MMAKSRNAALAGAVVVAALVMLALFQVPQPWRGFLIGWVILLGSLGILVLHFVKHYFEYKAVKLKTKPSPQKPAREARRSPRARARDDLRVILSDTAGTGRHTI